MTRIEKLLAAPIAVRMLGHHLATGHQNHALNEALTVTLWKARRRGTL
jgi:hypothetical protein